MPIANGGTGQTTVAAARNALGLGNTSGALPIANGGTGATGVSSQTLTLSSDFKAYDSASAEDTEYCGAIMYSFGPIVEVYGTVSPKSSLSTGAVKQITTIPSGYRPKKGVIQLCQGSNHNVWDLTIRTDGKVMLSRYRDGNGSSTIPTNAWLTFHAMWFKA